MTLGLDDDAHELRDSVRGWAARHAGIEVIRQAVEAGSDSRPAFWDSLAELGMLGLHLPEAVGGSGYTVLETALVVEELGRSMVPGPFLPSVVVSAAIDAAGRADHLRGLADGTTLGAVSLSPGSLRITRRGDEVTLSGVSDPAMGGQVADLFLLAARDDDAEEGTGPAPGPGAASGSRGMVFVLLEPERLDVVDLPGHDLVRRHAQVSADGVVLGSEELLAVEPQHVLDLAATLFSAEAAGLADWATTTAADYARVRRQFGRVIGQFQGVKHKAARMVCRTQQATVTAWDAARAQSEVTGGGAPSFAAAVAAATAPDAAFAVTRDCIQVLGGIGYTWEHPAHLYLRRAQALRITLGGTAAWRRRVAELTTSGTRRTLSIDLPSGLEKVREDIRAELAEATGLPENGRIEFLAARGYTAPHLPAPWGRGADAPTQLAIAEELDAAGLRPHDMIIGNWVVPTVLEHGDPEQIRRWVPGSLNGRITWCQMFSEPEAGSDLAALATRAVKVDGGWSLDGQKVWTSKAHVADWGICLARTDTDAPKHEGLSYFMIDLRNTDGIDIRPLRDITGLSSFNEVFLDGVFVPDDCLVGEPGSGWSIARTTLANERVSIGHGSSLGTGGEALLTLAEQLPGGLDAEQRSLLGAVVCDAYSGELMRVRSAIRSVTGAQPGTEASVVKLLSVEHLQQVWEVAMDWGGPGALVTEEGRHSAPHMFLNVQCMSIAGGTTNIQLNIIGERVLGLPRDAGPHS